MLLLPRPPRAVIFDMDGLLLDSEIHYRASIITAAEKRGLPIDERVYEGMLGQPWAGISKLFKQTWGEDFDSDDFRGLWLEHFHARLETELKLKAGVVELLDLLDTLDLPRAIATSSAPHQVEHHLAGFDLLRRFDAVVAQGDYLRGKPAPDPYLVAAERLGVAPADCLAFEDSHNGIRSAHAAGMMAVMVPDLLGPTEEIEALCVHVAKDLNECLQFFAVGEMGLLTPR
jgi:HAD superfamily hydrolase (TIGR01509 family)